MSLIQRLKQAVFGLTLLAMLASGCSFKKENARGSFFTLPFFPDTWVTYENLDKENHKKVLGKKEIKVHQGFTSSSMVVKNYDSEGNYLGEYRIKKQNAVATTYNGGRETSVAWGRRTRARIFGTAGSYPAKLL